MPCSIYMHRSDISKMKTCETFSAEALKGIIAHHFDLRENEVELEKCTTGKFNSTYYVQSSEGPLVLRISPPADSGFLFYERNMMAQEPGVHELVLKHTSAPVAKIYVYDNSRTLIDRDYLVMERLPGRPLSTFFGSQDTALFETGRFLRQIHDIKTDKYGYLGEHAPMEAQESWLDAFVIMWNKLLDDIYATGHYDKRERDVYARLLDKHKICFDRPVTSRLLHMDIWGQNILVDEDGHVTGIVDFDRALWGDKEIEFAVLDYCGISHPAFWEGYGEKRDISDDARVRRIFYLLYELQKYIVISHHRRDDHKQATAYKLQANRLAAQLY